MKKAQCGECGRAGGYPLYGMRCAEEMLKQSEQEPVYTDPQGWRNNVAQAYLKGFDEASTPSFKAKERLIRVMGTFDLATGHASTFDELLDSLESELRDVLGHYREALAQPEQEPVAWMVTYGGLTHIAYTQPNMVVDTHYQPLYAAPPRREWVGLTDEEIEAFDTSLKPRVRGELRLGLYL